MGEILVTGATGFIGSHLVEHLLELGESVRCLVRKTSNLKNIIGLDVEIVEGDITNPESLDKAVRGVDCVYHLANIIDRPDVSLTTYRFNNVQGSRNLFEKCLEHNVGRIVYFSSIAAVGFYCFSGSRGQVKPVDETVPCHPVTPYGISKYETEQLALSLHREKGLPVVILRPPTVFGPREEYATSELFKAIAKGRFRIIGDGENLMSFSYVRNITHAAILASNSPVAIGKIYFVGDERAYKLKEIASTIAEEIGVELSRMHIPPCLAWVAGATLEVAGMILGFQPPLSRRRVWTLTHSYAYDISRAKRELNYSPIYTLREGVRLTVEWLRSMKYI